MLRVLLLDQPPGNQDHSQAQFSRLLKAECTSRLAVSITAGKPLMSGRKRSWMSQINSAVEAGDSLPTRMAVEVCMNRAG